MATIQILDSAKNTTVDTVQTLYTAGVKGVVVESFTAVNNSQVNASYKAYIVNVSSGKPIIPFRIVVWGEDDLGVGLVNQIIPEGAELRFESSALDSIYFTATGREVG